MILGSLRMEVGMVTDLNIYAPVSQRDGELQPHAHLLLTKREIKEDGSFGNKMREGEIENSCLPGGKRGRSTSMQR